MADPLVVVTYPLNSEMEAANREVLGDVAEIVFSSRLEEEERDEVLGRADALLSWNLPRELKTGALGRARALRFLQTISAGVDHVDFTQIPDRVIVASNVGAYAEPMAEHVMAMALACAKRLRQRHNALARGDFDQRSLSLSLDGAVCLIVGFGGIGKATARLMRPFGAQIWALNTSGRTEEPVSFSGTLSDLGRVLGAADVIVLALPLTVATRGLITEREFGLMKPAAILVNVARGEVIDERALYEHLQRNPEFSAGIDTWWSEPMHEGEFRTEYPFLELPNLIGSPHNSPLVAGVLPRAVRRAAENVGRFLRGEPLTGVVRREDYVRAG